MTRPHLVSCTHERHAQAILNIFNDAIAHSTALYDYQPRPLEGMAAWFAAKDKGQYPVVGLEDDTGTLLAFGSFGPFRAFPAYKYTVEHSVYVHQDHRGQGLGFRHVGTLPQVGFKFGRWLDLAFYQLLLDTPLTPVDG